MCMCIRSYTVLTVQCVVHWLIPVYCRQVYFILEAIGILSILSYNGCPAFITYTQNVIYGVLQSVMQAINFGEILVWVVVLLSSRCTCRQGSLFKGWGMVTLYVAQCVADHQHWWKLVRHLCELWYYVLSGYVNQMFCQHYGCLCQSLQAECINSIILLWNCMHQNLQRPLI